MSGQGEPRGQEEVPQHPEEAEEVLHGVILPPSSGGRAPEPPAIPVALPSLLPMPTEEPTLTQPSPATSRLQLLQL